MPSYIHPSNPFARGFNDLRIRRLLAILYDAQAPMCYLPPHPSQQHLSDGQLERHLCLLNEHHALIISPGTSLADHEDTYPHQGIVVQVIYAIFSYDQSPPILVGDLYSESLARKRIQQLEFKTPHFSRCFEISSAHLPDTAWTGLQALLLPRWPTDLWFEPFTFPDSHALGLKLIATPWTDDHLNQIDGSTAEQLRQQQLEAGISVALVDMLHLAAQADVRILIFDPDAACLEGLPTYGPMS